MTYGRAIVPVHCERFAANASHGLDFAAGLRAR
jgi:hypothetical protein